MGISKQDDLSSPEGTPDTTLLDSRIGKALDDRGLSHGGAGGGGDGGAKERLARLEGVFESFKAMVDSVRHSQNMTLGALGILVATVIAMGVYAVSRLDSLDQKIDAVPQQINADVRGLTQTLATSITAAKQQPPQVILIPTPPQQRQPIGPPKQP